MQTDAKRKFLSVSFTLCVDVSGYNGENRQVFAKPHKPL